MGARKSYRERCQTVTRRQLFGRLLAAAVGLPLARVASVGVAPALSKGGIYSRPQVLRIGNGDREAVLDLTHLRSPYTAVGRPLDLNARWIADTKDFLAAVERADTAVRGLQV